MCNNINYGKFKDHTVCRTKRDHDLLYYEIHTRLHDVHHPLHIPSRRFETWDILNPEHVTNISKQKIGMIRLWAALPRNFGLMPGRSKRLFSSPECPEQLGDPHSLLLNGYWRFLYRVKWPVQGTNHSSVFSAEVMSM
jgi:hypothetical protein